MPIINPDTSDAIQIDRNPIVGTHKAKVVKATPKTSKAGNPMVEIEFGVSVAGRQGEAPRTAWLVTTGKGSWNFDQFLRAIHMDKTADAAKAGQKPQIDTDSFIGQELMLNFEERLYKEGDEGGPQVTKKGDEIVGYLKV